MPKERVKVSIFTQVYNAEAYLDQCIGSVLAQSYSNFEYIIANRGSTDGSKGILERYAAQDERIRVLHYEQNETSPRAVQLMRTMETGSYVTLIDADDWWESDYLERLVGLAEKCDLDIVCTGTCVHVASTGKVYIEKQESVQICTKEYLLQNFADAHIHFKTMWGKLIRTDIFRKTEEPPRLACSSDTVFCYNMLCHIKRIGLDDSAMYHYRIHRASVSHEYRPVRFDSDVYVYHAYVNLVSAAGTVSQRNRNCIDEYYSCIVRRTLQIIYATTKISPREKLCEYRRMAEHETMRNTYIQPLTDCRKLRIQLLQCTVAAKCELEGENADFSAILNAIEPYCNDLDDELPFCEQMEICRLLEKDRKAEALERMDAVLQMEGSTLYSMKVFVGGYLALAEKENRADLVQFGREKLADFYLRRGDVEKYRTYVKMK